jgi:xanthine dehydrogenase large subunit
MQNTDSKYHVSGKSIYVDDIPVLKGTLYGKVFASPVAHGIVKKLDTSAAEAHPGVAGVFTAADIPGHNQIGGIVPDEVLFAEEKVEFNGQPMAFVVAVDELTARKAAALIKADIEPLEPITDPRIAKEKGKLLIPSSTFKSGNIEAAWQQCEHIFEGRADVNGQEHLYIETQGSYAYPTENGSIKIHSSTQGPTHVQHTTAHVLGIPMHRVEVDVTRLGGAFGGKEDQATAYACMAALAVYKLKKPVKVILHRMDDMRMTGKRHPYSADFRIGLDKDLNILAYQATFYQNGGAATDLSPAILDRSLFHSTNCYYIPNTEVTAYSCKTNLPPNTAFRGFGGPQGMYIIESAIAKAAKALNIPAQHIQQRNFLKENDAFQYGQIATNVNIGHCFKTLDEKHSLKMLRDEVEYFNKNNSIVKKGLAVMPICFGISFTKTTLNQARALVHIYQDGSIGVSTGAIEMGQGVNTKIMQVAAQTFSVSTSRVKLESTNTTRVSNTSPTAASAGADLNGKATQIACSAMKDRLLEVASGMLDIPKDSLDMKDEWIYNGQEKTNLRWEKMVQQAYTERVCLTENGHYATPVVHFDTKTKKGHPFAYHVYGASVWIVKLDCIRGTYEFEKVAAVHDFGNSMNYDIDRGQAEGALVQGMGWMTIEELSYNEDGRLLSNSLSTYKIPDIYSVPKTLDIIPLETTGPKQAILRSKAVGEPPLMYGIGAFFALQNAIMSFNPKAKIDFDAPMTPEKVLMRLYGSELGV